MSDYPVKKLTTFSQWQESVQQNIQEIKGPGWPPYPNGVEPLTYKQVMDNMVASFYTQTGTEFQEGTMIATLLSVVAEQVVTMHNMMAQIQSIPFNGYIYPDGSYGGRKPVDGEMFVLGDPSTGFYRRFQWDDLKGQWFDISVKSPTASEIFYGSTVGKTLAEEKCECGSEAAGSNRHSNWCNKWSPEA